MKTDGDERPRLDPKHLRRAQPLNQTLPSTRRWVARLPPDIRPRSLLDEFPRIANALARFWPDAPDLGVYLDSLVHDRRGGRRGFPGHVQIELLMLRDFFEGRYPAARSVGDDQAAGDETRRAGRRREK